jgi:hypothetical protein
MVLMADDKGALCKLERSTLIQIDNSMLRTKSLIIERVSRTSHWPHGLVEARVKVIGKSLGKLNHRATSVTPLDLAHYVEMMVSLFTEWKRNYN